MWSFIKISGGYYKDAYIGIIYFLIRNISKILSRDLLIKYLHFWEKIFLCKISCIKTSDIKITNLKKRRKALFNLIRFFLLKHEEIRSMFHATRFYLTFIYCVTKTWNCNKYCSFDLLAKHKLWSIVWLCIDVDGWIFRGGMVEPAQSVCFFSDWLRRRCDVIWQVTRGQGVSKRKRK